MSILQLLQIISAALLIVFILLQGGGAGLSSPFGGGGETFRTRRGVEKILLFATILAAAVFVFAAFANLLI